MLKIAHHANFNAQAPVNWVQCAQSALSPPWLHPILIFGKNWIVKVEFSYSNCTWFSKYSRMEVQIFNIFFAAVPKRRHLDSTRLTQGPTPHHPTRGSFREARGSTYFQCNVSKYAHVLGLKLPKIRLVRAWLGFWVSSRKVYHISEPRPGADRASKVQSCVPRPWNSTWKQGVALYDA